jgi:two-component system, NarL family, sensor histidine kinase DegS
VTRGVAGEPALSLSGIGTLVGPLRERVREPAFWFIQTAVLGITALHVGLEAIDFTLDERALVLGLHHIPVVLYLLPIAYAGLRYGFEGALLTGAWCLVLTLPNMLLWHPHGWEWLGEFLYVALVISVGVVIAVPVERERKRRQELTAASRRLALMNELGSELVSTAQLERSVERVVRRLVEALDLDSVSVRANVRDEGDDVIAIAGAVERSGGAPRGQAVTAARSTPLGFPLHDGRSGTVGAMMISPRGTAPLSAADVEMLGAVADRIGTAIDNAALHRRERVQLRRYVRGVTRAQEDERQRVALELHDTVAQDLVRVNRKLDDLTAQVSDGVVAAGIADIRSMTRTMFDGLRRLSRALRPPVLDDLGLSAAVEWLATDLSSRGTDVETSVRGTARRLPRETELALFRICQEALRNIERHAHAEHVTVTLTFTPGSIEVVVEDDGDGFDTDGHDDGSDVLGHLGIAGMRERAELVSAKLTLTSSRGDGTRVGVTVPTS